MIREQSSSGLKLEVYLKVLRHKTHCQNRVSQEMDDIHSPGHIHGDVAVLGIHIRLHFCDARSSYPRQQVLSENEKD